MAKQGKMDSIFNEGPEDFLDKNLRTYVEHFNPDLKNPIIKEEEIVEDAEPPKETDELSDAEEDDDSEFQGADAWKKDAIKYCREVRWGSLEDFEAVWGTDIPPDYLTFQNAVAGANPWSTFNELRLSEGSFINPSEDKNLFEMIVLLDQLAYLGTNLAEVFSGVVALGSLGNGDTYHYELFETELNDGSFNPRFVHAWDHETHDFNSDVFADSITSMTYLCSLTKALDEELISEDVAAEGFVSLRGRVSPTWHFSIEDHDEDFEYFEADVNIPRFSFWRSAWIQYFLRNNGIVSIEDLGGQFLENLNSPLSPEDYKRRIGAMKTYTATAVYMMWKAFMFDEPELEEILVICADHKGRIVRDCEKLIREFQNGREKLGRIENIHEHLERFRALDLDPRRAEEKAKEEAEAAKKAAEEMEKRYEKLDGLATSELENFAWDQINNGQVVAFQADWTEKFEHLSWSDETEQTGVREAILQRLASENPEAIEGINFLIEGGSSRRNSIYRIEEDQAQKWVGQRLTPAIEAVLVGDIIHQTAARGVGHSAGIDILKYSAGLDSRSLTHLRSQVKIGQDGKPIWGARRVIDLLGVAKDEGSLPIFEAILDGQSDEGGFETRMHFDDFIATIAKAIEKIGKAEGAKMLLPFANSKSFRSAPAACSYTIAKIAPQLGTMELCKSILHSTTENNSGTRTGRVMVAVGLIGREQNAENKKELLDLLLKTDAYGTNYVQAKVGIALASHLLGGDGLFEGKSFNHWLEACLTGKGWKEEYTLAQRIWALEIYAMFPEIDLKKHLDELLTWRDPNINSRLEKLGMDFVPAKEITWFEAKDMTDAELKNVLSDQRFGFRWHAARALAEKSQESGRGALEKVLEEVLEKAPTDQGSDLSRELNMLLTESIIGLKNLPEADSTLTIMDALLRHSNRNVKGPVLRETPASDRFIGAMQQIVNERYGWQESAAQNWLDANAPDLEIPPPGDVPKEAWWDEDDNEWVLGQKDDQDRFNGLVQYWRPDGTLCCENHFVDGQPGAFQRFHENGEVSREGIIERGKLIGKDTAFRSTEGTSENAFPRSAAEQIHSIETYWEDGKRMHKVMRDSEGNQVTNSGEPVPSKPDSVPEHAFFQADDEAWASGAYGERATKIGKWTYYNNDGKLLREEEH